MTWSAKISRLVLQNLRLFRPSPTRNRAEFLLDPVGRRHRRHKPIGRRWRCQPSGRDPCQNGKGRTDGRTDEWRGDRDRGRWRARASASSGIWDMQKARRCCSGTGDRLARSASAKVTQPRVVPSLAVRYHFGPQKSGLEWSGVRGALKRREAAVRPSVRPVWRTDGQPRCLTMTNRRDTAVHSFRLAGGRGRPGPRRGTGRK